MRSCGAQLGQGSKQLLPSFPITSTPEELGSSYPLQGNPSLEVAKALASCPMHTHMRARPFYQQKTGWNGSQVSLTASDL